MSRIGIIGGSGLQSLAGFEIDSQTTPTTTYGAPSSPLFLGKVSGREVVFLARHGIPHTIPPHRINYRANVDALAELDVTGIVSVTAVGGIADNTPPLAIVIPDQLIDYTYGRAHTFSDSADVPLQHVDFTFPFDPALRDCLIENATRTNTSIVPHGTYGVTQGPRLETAAEIRRMSQDGCTIVGMTAMPEAGLARERNIPYANCSLVVNWAAGAQQNTIDLAEVEDNLETGMSAVNALITSSVAALESR